MPTFGEEAKFMGYSDHTIGIAASLLALTRGAEYIEKHYTLDRSQLCELEKAHQSSMDFKEAKQLRTLGDSISGILKY